MSPTEECWRVRDRLNNSEGTRREGRVEHFRRYPKGGGEGRGVSKLSRTLPKVPEDCSRSLLDLFTHEIYYF